jgi:hypothetical protein
MRKLETETKALIQSEDTVLPAAKTGSGTSMYRRTAIVVGILFIIATAFSLVSTSLTEPLTGSSSYLVSISANADQMTWGALFLLGAAVAVALIPAMVYPVLKRVHEGMALGYLGLRVLESATQVVGAFVLLMMISASQGFVVGGATAGSYQVSGALLLAANNWAFWLDPLVFGTDAAILYYLTYRSRLIPRWLSLWGLVGAPLVFAVGLLGMFGIQMTYLAVPIAVQEMAMAVWLIARGFNPSAVARMSD